MKKCYQEVLNVDPNCTQEQMRKQYYKTALKYHPDKNKDSEDSTEMFQLIQEAYETLGDPQSRAWYDSNREKILSGNQSENFSGNLIDLFPYFNQKCQNNKIDDANFQKIQDELFKSIYQQEIKFCNINKRDDKISFKCPSFGNSHAHNEQINLFYDQWIIFSSDMTFSWEDEYDERQAEFSKMKRAMKQENERGRSIKRKEYSQSVRSLVKFVKNKDPRYAVLKAEEERVAKEKERKLKEEAKQRKLEKEQKIIRDMEEFEKMHLHEEEIAMNQVFVDGNDIHPDDLQCEVCDIEFENVSTKEKHLKTRKHKDNVEILKRLMHQEEKEMHHENKDNEGEEVNEKMDEKEEDYNKHSKFNNLNSNEKNKTKKGKGKNSQNNNTVENKNNEYSNNNTNPNEDKINEDKDAKSKKNKNKNKNKNKMPEMDELEDDDPAAKFVKKDNFLSELNDINGINDEDDTFINNNKKKKKNKK